MTLGFTKNTKIRLRIKAQAGPINNIKAILYYLYDYAITFKRYFKRAAVVGGVAPL